jgi:phage-related protein
MKDFDNSYIARINSEEAVAFWLVDLEISDSSHQYFCTLDIDIVFEGNTYKSAALKVGEMNVSLDMAVDSVKLEFANIDLKMSATLLNNNLARRPAVIHHGAMDGYTPIIEEAMTGFVGGWDLDEKRAEITVVNEFVFWNKRTLRQSGVLCPWPFKGTECGYSGSEESCNSTYERCQALSNSDNFGGFRFMAAMEEKEIWWGSKPA